MTSRFPSGKRNWKFLLIPSLNFWTMDSYLHRNRNVKNIFVHSIVSFTLTLFVFSTSLIPAVAKMYNGVSRHFDLGMWVSANVSRGLM